MKILMVNNHLSVLGGSETYMFSVGEELKSKGHDVQYFGLRDPKGNHGNAFGIYAKKSYNPFAVISNKSNARRFAKLLDKFEPDVIHINLMYFILTPAIIDEAIKRNIPIVQTIHDPKIICPNHRLYLPREHKACALCVESGLRHCVSKKCVKNSTFFSYLAARETQYWQKNGLLEKIDRFIFPSVFMKDVHIAAGLDEERTTVLRNFTRIARVAEMPSDKFSDRYVLYFGRLSTEKGMRVLAETIRKSPGVKYKIVGSGDCGELFSGMPNCEVVGFLSGERLVKAIKYASICVFPSIWYENCPMSILESIALGTPVIGSNIGGIPELIDVGKTGFVVKPGDSEALKNAVESLFFDQDLLSSMSKSCVGQVEMDDVASYVGKLTKIYSDLRRKSK